MEDFRDEDARTGTGTRLETALTVEGMRLKSKKRQGARARKRVENHNTGLRDILETALTVKETRWQGRKRTDTENKEKEKTITIQNKGQD